MVDSKTVISQVQEFQLILHDIHAEGMVLGESFQVAALIEKLPLTWKDFKNYLKHKRKEMKLEDLIVRLRIEEDNRQSEKKAGNYHQEAKANVIEQDVLPLYLGRLSSRTVSTVAGRISLKDSESNSRLGSPVLCPADQNSIEVPSEVLPDLLATLTSWSYLMVHYTLIHSASGVAERD
ncbi:hypothetical protein RJ639_036189 [Escallonia herrerae]|uniref:Uncharacterized protein n=1 Tax=Escallonia herrerae TaxID=1293975 RepID=A0AA88WSP8_9ASTE|nr:hypothetical protein RJ639_036189 [Escallonia herrerae]